MLGSLPLVAMRQQHHHAAVALPFRFAGGDELIDDDLGAVSEITELRFPQNQRMRRIQTITELETQDRRLGQQTVVGVETRLLGSQTVQGRVRLAGAGIEDNRMALAEGAAAAVLAAQTYRRPF